MMVSPAEGRRMTFPIVEVGMDDGIVKSKDVGVGSGITLG